MKPTLVVLAAGIGSRYGGLKQLDPIGAHGELIIDYSVFDALRAGFGKVVFVIRRDLETDFRETIGRRFEGRLPVAYAFQELDDLPAGFALPPDRAKPWGTGHAILAARNTVGEPFAVINADDFYGRAGYRLLAEHLAQQPEPAEDAPAGFSMVGFVLRNTLSEHGHVARGICAVDADGMLSGVVERTRIERHGEHVFFHDADGDHPLTGDEIVSLNMWGFTPALFPFLERAFEEFLRMRGHDPKAEIFIPGVVDEMIRAGLARVTVLTSSDHWFGVTYREDKPRVEAGIRTLIARGEYPVPLWRDGNGKERKP